jgi:hypothetical protein
MGEIAKQTLWIKYPQWVFRGIVVLSIISSLIPFLITDRDMDIKYESIVGPWFYWYSIPSLIIFYIVLVILWQVIGKSKPVKTLFPKTDFWFLLGYILFWLVMVFLAFRYGF